MIILVSGTNGAGKTHLVRRVLAELGPVTSEIPRKPPGYKVIGSRHGQVTVMGRYDGPTCGGCDCFSWKGAADDIEIQIKEEVEQGQRVLLEGVIVSTWGKPRLLRMKPLGLQVVHLTTSLEDCLESINSRRRARAAARGQEFVPVPRANVADKHRGLANGIEGKILAGIPTHTLDREAAYQHVLQQLKGA